MNFSGAGFFYVAAGETIDLAFWWGSGDTHGAVFAMALWEGSEGISYFPNPGPPPSYRVDTLSCGRETRFSFGVADSQEIDYSYPIHTYHVSVQNRGPSAAYFQFDGMTTA